MRRIQCFFLCILMILLSSCSAVELQTRVTAALMGIDWKNDRCYISMLAFAASEEAEGFSVEMQTVDGEDFQDAIKRLEQRNNEALFYGQLDYIILGTGFDNKKREDTVSYLWEAFDENRRLWLFFAPGGAEEVVFCKTGDTLRAVEAIEKLDCAHQMPLTEVYREILARRDFPELPRLYCVSGGKNADEEEISEIVWVRDQPE